LKDTRHIVFDLHGSGLAYNAGDALGVIPENCPDLVSWVLEALDASGAPPASSGQDPSARVKRAPRDYAALTARGRALRRPS